MVLVTFQKEINHLLLLEELKSNGYSEIAVRPDNCEVLDVGVTEADIQSIIDAHSATGESISQVIEANRTVLIDNARARFQTELETGTPDWPALYTDVQTALSTRPNVLSRMQNMSDLIATALGIADLSLVSAGQRNAIRLVAVILVLVLYR